MNLFHIRHRTHYKYDGWVIDSANQLKLYPLQDQYQKVRNHQVHISDHPAIQVTKDYFGNATGFFSILSPHQELIIESLLEVEISPFPEPDLKPDAGLWTQIQREEIQLQYHDYLKAEMAECHLEVQGVIAEIWTKEVHPLVMIQQFSEFIYNHFTYQKGVTTVETSVDEIWKLKAGVCQDFAHMLLYMLRLVGIPGRYISGYICPGSSEWRGEGATHAWAEAWLPDTGWIGIDPTNKCMAGQRHVRIATGRNFTDCTPVKGTYRGAQAHRLEVTVNFGDHGFTESPLAQVMPTYSTDVEVKEGVKLNSYTAYLQMQQQQQ